MKVGFLDTADDVSWLNDVHLKGVPLPSDWKDFKSAVLQGNEDAPHAVNLYKSQSPHNDDNYLRVKFPGDGLVYAEYSEYDGKIDMPGTSQVVTEEDRVAAKKKTPRP